VLSRADRRAIKPRSAEITLPWFVKENRRVAPRHHYDGNNTWIRLEGSLTRQCQVLDLSRTGVRLTVTNAHSLPNKFTLILSKNCSGRPARVKWRRGTEVGAEFLKADSSSLTAPRAVKPGGSKGQKSESLMSRPSLRAQAQRPAVGKSKAEERKGVGSISGDKAKTEAYCQITKTGGAIVQAARQKDEKKAEALIQRINELEKMLNPESPGLFNALYEADPNSKDVQDILLIFAMLDQSRSE
jgi:hypothetical protein